VEPIIIVQRPTTPGKLDFLIFVLI
jgi:hypothetical protein